MKIKNLFFLLLMLVCFSSLALAETDLTAITFTAPSSSGTVYGTYTFTGTYTGNGTGNITVNYNASEDNTAVFICADTTITASSSTWSCSGVTTGFADDCSGHTIYAVGYNNNTNRNENQSANGTVTAIFDNTAPTASTITFTKSQLKSKERITYTCTGIDACDTSLGFSIVLTKPNGGTVTKTSDSDNFNEGDTVQQGSYSAICTVTDNGVNTLASSAGTFRVSGSSTAGNLVTQQTTTTTVKNSNLMMITMLGMGFLVISVFGVLGLWYFNQSKKRT